MDNKHLADKLEFEDATRDVKVHFCIPDAPKGMAFGLPGLTKLHRLDKGGAPSKGVGYDSLSDRFEAEDTVFLADKVHESYLLRLVTPEGKFLSWAPYSPQTRVGNWFTGVISVERGTPAYSPEDVKKRTSRSA